MSTDNGSQLKNGRYQTAFTYMLGRRQSATWNRGRDPKQRLSSSLSVKRLPTSKVEAFDVMAGVRASVLPLTILNDFVSFLNSCNELNNKVRKL